MEPHQQPETAVDRAPTDLSTAMADASAAPATLEQELAAARLAVAAAQQELDVRASRLEVGKANSRSCATRTSG
jgi:hypothetical protein